MLFCNFRFFCLLFGLVVTFTQVLGQNANSLDDLQVLEEDQRQLLWNHLTSQCDRLDRQRAERLAKALKSPAALKQHLTKLRDDYRNILGSFPKKQPLNAKVTGKLDGTSYRVRRFCSKVYRIIMSPPCSICRQMAKDLGPGYCLRAVIRPMARRIRRIKPPVRCLHKTGLWC